MSGRGGFGPGFQAAGSKLYRTEYAAVTLAILGYLFYRWFYLGGLDWPSTVFWVIFPDLVAFIPIRLSQKRKEWPRWGSYLYNVFHTLLAWGLAFALSWFALGTPYWRIFGWVGHITADRAVGYGLRSSTRQISIAPHDRAGGGFQHHFTGKCKSGDLRDALNPIRGSNTVGFRPKRV